MKHKWGFSSKEGEGRNSFKKYKNSPFHVIKAIRMNGQKTILLDWSNRKYNNISTFCIAIILFHNNTMYNQVAGTNDNHYIIS